MRNLARDTQTVYLSRFGGLVRQTDAQGRLTGKNIPQMSEPEAFSPSVSMARGEAQGAYFGMNLDYDKVLTIDDHDFAVKESDKLWIDASPGDPEDESYPNEHDYVVMKVAHKGDFTVIAAKHVEVRK